MAPFLRVMCIGTHQLFLDCLRDCLTREPDLRVVGSPSSLENLIDSVVELKPDVLTIEVHPPDEEVKEVMTQLASVRPALRIVLFSSCPRESTRQTLMNFGASSVVHINEPLVTLMRAIRGRSAPSIQSNDQEYGNHLGSHNGHVSQEDLAALARLTPREIEVLRLIGEGQSRVQIAEAIFRSPKTVDAHRGSIMDKIGVRDRAHLVRFSIRVGLVNA